MQARFSLPECDIVFVEMDSDKVLLEKSTQASFLLDSIRRFCIVRGPKRPGGHSVKQKDELAKKLSELEKRFAKSGLRLTDGSSKVKAMAFVGGVRKRNNLPPDVPSS